jgi:hypothetical protein
LNYFNYFTEIEDTFVRRRGKHLFLSPLDWATIETWQERGILLHIVIRSIESVFDVFDKQPPGTRSIKTLFYCREEVEVQHAEWLRSQAGKSKDDEPQVESSLTREVVGKHIDDTIEVLRAHPNEHYREGFTRAADRLEELRQNLTGNFETVDKTLHDIEKLLDRALLGKIDSANLKALEKEVAVQLRAYKSEMDADSYRSTYELLLLKRLREEIGIPRLGLFHL